MSIQTIRAGATAEALVTNNDSYGSAEPRAGWALEAAWIPPDGFVAPAAVITAVDDYTWLVVAASTGLAGYSALLRFTATHAATGRVRVTDVQYRVVA